MSAIRTLLLAASASCALSGCTTSSDGGGLFASLKAPIVEPRDCREVAKEAVSLSARAMLTLQMPGRDVREGPGGSVIIAWPEPKVVGAVNEEMGREMATVRQDAETASCPVFFDGTGIEPPMRVAALPVVPVDASVGLPPPEQPVVVVTRAPEPVPPLSATPPASRPAGKSAWTDVPAGPPASAAGAPVTVAGGNPALEPARPPAAKPAPRKLAPVVAAKTDVQPAVPPAAVEAPAPKAASAPARAVPPKPAKPRVIPITPTAVEPAPAQPTP